MLIMSGIMIPFIGTTLGAGCVFFMKHGMAEWLQKALLGFASGVMIAASVWSLLIPSIHMSEQMGRLSFVPALAGLMLGVLFLYLLDRLTPHLHLKSDEPEGPRVKLGNTAMLMLAVTLHNIPEGMAVGVVFAGLLSDSREIGLSAAYALAVGIAIQNFPEGAIISLPFCSEGNSKKRSFGFGVLSGIVEPLAAGATVLLAELVTPTLPYFLAFAAGAMIYVVIEELIPEATRDNRTDICTWGFAIGFAIMMVLDVALG